MPSLRIVADVYSLRTGSLNVLPEAEMSEPRIRLYIAVSLDGYIADAEGSVDWLSPYDSFEVGFGDFLKEIDTIVSGRKTYEQALGFGNWPYADKRFVVLTNRALGDAPQGVTAHAGDVVGFAAALKRESKRDIWLLGGARVAQDFLAADLIDSWELYVVPAILGEGISLFARDGVPCKLHLADSHRYENGIVSLIYARGV